jgi:MFS family permease
MIVVYSSLSATVAALLVASAAAFRGVWSPCGLSMISAINPFTERSRGHRYGFTAAWFIVGSVLGGSILGGIGVLGALLVSAISPPTGILVALAAACALITLAADARAFGIRLPLIPRQVNERWIGGYRRWVYASGFGAQIGVGLATYVMTAAVYLTPVLGALSGSGPFALGLGVVFGFVRGSAVLISSRARGPELLLALHRQMAALELWSLRLTIFVQAAAALVLAGASAGRGGAAVVVGLVVVGALLHRATVPRRSNVGTGRQSSSAVR